MDPNVETSAPSSIVTASSVSDQTPPGPNIYHILEISLISAQDLAPISKSLRTYALVWIHPNRKRSTRIDSQGQCNPAWNDKFSFRVDGEFLNADTSAVHVEIYTTSWFRDILVGTVRVLVSNLVHQSSRTKRFVALQIRKPSGDPQGILNMGVALLDSTMRSMPLYIDQTNRSSLDHRDVTETKISQNLEQDKQQRNSKVQLWRSLSAGNSEVNSDLEFPYKAGSICNGSMLDGSVCNGSVINGSELCSDIGPSASIVAAEIAKKLQPLPPPRPVPPKSVQRENVEFDDGESSILEEMTAEEAYGKALLSEKCKSGSGHARRHSDGGVFSCFGNAYGFEVTIVCGANDNIDKENHQKVKKSSKSRKKWSSDETNSI